jgi:hypothetical protein
LSASCPAVLDLVHRLPAQHLQIDREGLDLLPVQEPVAGLDRYLVPRATPCPQQLPPHLEDLVALVEPVAGAGRLQAACSSASNRPTTSSGTSARIPAGVRSGGSTGLAGLVGALMLAVQSRLGGQPIQELEANAHAWRW